METKDVIYELRTGKGLSQEELAEKVFVTRQAVSRWETGETVPNTETLKLLSALFDVSINTLLGTPRQLICQCCGMPLEDGITSREPDGSYNEDYCKWCYAEGSFAYQSKAALLGINLPDRISSMIAENITANVRQIEGVLNKILAYSDLMGKRESAYRSCQK